MKNILTLPLVFIVMLVALPTAAFALAGDGKFSQYRVYGAPIDLTVGVDGGIWVLGRDGELSRVSISGKVSNKTVRLKGGAGDDTLFLASSGDGFLTYPFNAPDEAFVQRTVRGAVRVRSLDRAGVKLGDTGISDVIQGPTGSVWFATSGHIGVLLESGRFKQFKIPYRKLGYQFETLSPRLAVGADGNIWFTSGSGVGRVTSKGRFLPYLEIFGKDSPSTSKLIARGGDEYIWVVADREGNMGRISPAGNADVLAFAHPDADTSGLIMTALGAGPGAAVWFVIGEEFEIVGGTVGDNLYYVDTNIDAEADVLPDYPQIGSMSGEAHELITGPDSRVWVPQLNVGRVLGYRPPRPLDVRNKSLTYRNLPIRQFAASSTLLRGGRVGSIVRVGVRCVGDTGGFCKGKLELRVSGRSVGKAVPYAIPAAPVKVNSRSAVRLKLSKSALRKVRRGARLSVRGKSGRSIVIR